MGLSRIAPSRLAILLPLALWIAAGAALAADGRREINQASVLAAGGFPFVITTPGSYLLTSDLTPPADVIGIRIDTDDVSLDLNGFAIRGSLLCVPGSCSGTGPSRGIAASSVIAASGRRCIVRNGMIKGVNGTAVELRDDALVEGLSVSNAFVHGIVVGPRSLVTRSRISAVGRSGIVAGAGSGYAENVVAATGQFFALGSIVGGTQVGRNACDDGRCPPRRRFYLTSATTLGNAPLTACDGGFHFASAAEIAEPTQLQYFQFAGALPVPDGGGGPPSGSFGWVRDGLAALSGENCLGWASALVLDQGSALLWQSSRDDFPANRFTSGWVAFPLDCNTVTRTWCVED